jgi:hypothetical protein
MKKPKPESIDIKQDKAISELERIDKKHDAQFAYLFFFTGLLMLWCFGLSMVLIGK